MPGNRKQTKRERKKKKPNKKKKNKSNMCSNNTNNSVGVRGMANASGVGDNHDYESSSLRKAKKQRIPKRGPGVAELEKILREQEKKDGHVEKGKINIGGISSSLLPSLPNIYPPPHSSFATSSSSNSLPRNVSFLRNTPSTQPPLTALPGNVNINGNGSSQLGCENVGGIGNGRSKGVYIGGSGVFLPEQTLLPITWCSSETWKGDEAPKMATDFSFPVLVSNGSDHNKMLPPPMLQKNHGPCHISMMNHFPLSAISSSSTPSLSAGVYHHVEPPSYQKSCHNYTSTILPEEDKMMGAKRSRPNFPVDNWRPALPHMPCQPPPFRPQVSRLDPSSSSSNNGTVFNLGTAISRDPMPTNPLELKVKTCVNDHGNPSGNGSSPLITLGSPTTTLPSTTQKCQPDLSKFIKQFPFQEMKENSEGYLLQRKSSESEVSSVYKKSFFSLLQPEEQRGAAETTLGLKNEKCCTEKTGDFIDLNLKL